jgi:hypothetical protein
LQGFPDQESEIYFSKKIKPTDYSSLLYYRAVFDLESKCQKADSSVIRRCLQKRIYKINEYKEERQVKVQYFKCEYKHLDEKYFVRGTTEIPLELRSSHHLLDKEFFTWHDNTFSTIMDNEMLTDYIRKELDMINPIINHLSNRLGVKLILVRSIMLFYIQTQSSMEMPQ